MWFVFFAYRYWGKGHILNTGKILAKSIMRSMKVAGDAELEKIYAANLALLVS